MGISNTVILFFTTRHFVKGSSDGAVVRVLASHQCGPGLIPSPGVICGLSLLFVLAFAPRDFSPGTPVFASPQKPTFLNSNSIWAQWTKNHLVDMPLLIPIPSSIYLIPKIAAIISTDKVSSRFGMRKTSLCLVLSNLSQPITRIHIKK